MSAHFVYSHYRVRAQRAARYFSQCRIRHQINQPPSVFKRPKVDVGVVQQILQSPDLYSHNCVDRKHADTSFFPYHISRHYVESRETEREVLRLRQQVNAVRAQLAKYKVKGDDTSSKADLPAEDEGTLGHELRELKSLLANVERKAQKLAEDIARRVNELPNLTSPSTPLGEPLLLETSSHAKPQPDPWRDHESIGQSFDLLNFEEATITSGWGSYFLSNEAVQLEQALISYAQSIAKRHGFTLKKPPTMIYSDIVRACGYRPRDQHDEQQIYKIAQSESDQAKPKRSFSLAGTAEIPFAGMKANATIPYRSLPLKVVGPSNCYRAEAGAHGARSKGLYRVHEFTKVEMFAWTAPGQELEVFATMLKIQKEILDGLGFHYRVLEMPASDLGASAYRKQDIEVYFPSRANIDDGWGEVTSTSICTDYQTRRLNTRMTTPPAPRPTLPGSETLTSTSNNSTPRPSKTTFPSTINGTAVAIPRILAALLEYGLQNEAKEISIPECLWGYMGGVRSITRGENEK